MKSSGMNRGAETERGKGETGEEQRRPGLERRRKQDKSCP